MVVVLGRELEGRGRRQCRGSVECGAVARCARVAGLMTSRLFQGLLAPSHFVPAARLVHALLSALLENFGARKVGKHAADCFCGLLE